MSSRPVWAIWRHSISKTNNKKTPKQYKTKPKTKGETTRKTEFIVSQKGMWVAEGLHLRLESKMRVW